jgi:hypothetical protein
MVAAQAQNCGWQMGTSTRIYSVRSPTRWLEPPVRVQAYDTVASTSVPVIHKWIKRLQPTARGRLSRDVIMELILNKPPDRSQVGRM